jgi:hypothetical protein
MLGVAAASLTGQEAAKLMQQFLSFDSDLSGTLSFDEMAAAAKQVGGWCVGVWVVRGGVGGTGSACMGGWVRRIWL